MKITFILPQLDRSGGNRVVAIYADRLRQRGHEVTVVAPLQPLISWQNQLKEWLKGKGWTPQTRQTPDSHLDTLNVPYSQPQQPGAITDADVPDADLVIATWWATAEWVAALSPAKGAKCYFIQHHEVFDYQPIDRVKATYRLPLYKITISRWLVDLMAAEYGDRQVDLVPNSVDKAQFYAPPRSKQSQPTVGMLFSTLPWKGCDLSIAAVERVAKKIPNLRLVSFGTYRPTPALSLPDWADFSWNPDQSQIKDLYAQCDVWLCASETEGFCLPLLEAMACRTPVVSTMVGGAIDLISPGKNGYLATKRDADELAHWLLKVLNLSEAEWQVMSDAAYQTTADYSWDDAADRFEAALDRALKSQRAAV